MYVSFLQCNRFEYFHTLCFVEQVIDVLGQNLPPEKYIPQLVSGIFFIFYFIHSSFMYK